MTEQCVKCRHDVNMQNYTFKGEQKQKKVNPDGSNHNYRLPDGKWCCVTSKEHSEWTKTHGGPSGFLQPKTTQTSPQATTSVQEVTMTPRHVDLKPEEKGLFDMYKQKMRGVMVLEAAVREVLLENGDKNPDPSKVGLLMKLVCELA